MKVQLSDAAKQSIRDVALLLDDDKWIKIYNQFHEWAYIDDQHPLKSAEIGQITKFFEKECGIDILQHLTIIPRRFHIADQDILEFVVPANIEMIDDSAFRNCHRLSRLVIPVSVQAIGTYAFHGCNDLEYVEYQGTMKQWGLINKDYKWWTRGRIWDKRIVKCSDGDIEYD